MMNLHFASYKYASVIVSRVNVLLVIGGRELNNVFMKQCGCVCAEKVCFFICNLNHLMGDFMSRKKHMWFFVLFFI